MGIKYKLCLSFKQKAGFIFDYIYWYISF